MNLPRGAVIIASLSDPSGKPRPFLVLRSDHFAAHRLVTVLALTGTHAEAPTLRIDVEPTIENGLRVPTQAMIDHVQSIRVERVQGVVGQLASDDLQAISRSLAVYLGFADVKPDDGAQGGADASR